LYNNGGGMDMFIDTHCHLSKEDYDDIDLVLSENSQAGVSRIIISGCTKESILESLAFGEKYENVYMTLGYHPSEAKIVSQDDLNELRKQIQNEKVVGIGEIGLDYHYGTEDILEQQELFRKQLEIAQEFSLPVVIHSRDATADTINILKEYPEVKGDIHCFSGSVETARIYLKMGYKIGIGGVVTFKNSNLYKVVQDIGIDNILLETDSPYLTPTPYRGKKNSSKYIPIIAEKIAEILNISVEKVAEITSSNAESLFDLK